MKRAGIILGTTATMLIACSPDPMEPVPTVALSEHGAQQAESIARDMLANTYPAGDLDGAANCIREQASPAELLALIEAPRQQANAVLADIHASTAVRNCIAANNIVWRVIA